MFGKSIFQVGELVAGPEGWMATNPQRFFILETVFTSDGPRTRMCEGRYRTREQAEEALRAKEAASVAARDMHREPIGRNADHGKGNPAEDEGAAEDSE